MQSEQNDSPGGDPVDRQRSADQLRSFMRLRRNLRFSGYERPAEGDSEDQDSATEQRPNVERSSTWRYPVRRGPGG